MIREAAGRARAYYINDDTFALRAGALEAAAETSLPVSLIACRAAKPCREAPKYDDVFAEVNRYFIEQIARCEGRHVKKKCCSTRIRFR
ncbi:hypothetical protein KCP69_06125 [Salmonella enterica subsp. enterica]|nr:hypothetical protein KCP69_06125 [Salmonella enterica subsp. enterica]